MQSRRKKPKPSRFTEISLNVFLRKSDYAGTSKFYQMWLLLCICQYCYNTLENPIESKGRDEPECFTE